MTLSEFATKHGRKIKTSYSDSRIVGQFGYIGTCGVGKFLIEIHDADRLKAVKADLLAAGVWFLTEQAAGFEPSDDRQAKVALSAIGETPKQDRAIRVSF